MNILHITSYSIRATKTGGPALLLEKLNFALFKHGAQLSVVTTDGNLHEDVNIKYSGKTFETSEHGIPTIYVHRDRKIFPDTYYFAPHLPTWLKANIAKFDIVIVHGMWTYPSWVGARICQQMGKPYLIFVHGSLDFWALNYHRIKKVPYWHLIEKSNFQKASGVICLSQDEIEQVHNMGIKKPCFQARNGLLYPLPSIHSYSSDVLRSLPGLMSHPYVLFLSRLHPKKGLEVLIRAWQMIHAQYPEWCLVIAGPDEGGYQAKLLEMVQKFGLEDSVIFPGLVIDDKKIALFQRASVFVLPSFSEGVPTSVIEAMGYGLPVVITPGCHLPEVAQIQAGIITEPEPEAVARSILGLISDRDLRRRMGLNAGRLAITEFDQMKVAQGLVNFCQSILN